MFIPLILSFLCLCLAGCAPENPAASDALRGTVQEAQSKGAKTSEYEKERRQMVERQIRARGVLDQFVHEAMHKVPRHRFVPEALAHRAYEDNPLPIGQGQTISQPYIVAYMTEAAHVNKKSKVLEIDSGTLLCLPFAERVAVTL